MLPDKVSETFPESLKYYLCILQFSVFQKIFELVKIITISYIIGKMQIRFQNVQKKKFYLFIQNHACFNLLQNCFNRRGFQTLSALVFTIFYSVFHQHCLYIFFVLRILHVHGDLHVFLCIGIGDNFTAWYTARS